MKFADFQAADRRLVLLRGLEPCVLFTANAFLLRTFAESVGHVVSADTIETDLAWLAEQGLLTVNRSGGVTVATLTTRGLDVATGRATVPGVKRPEPGA
jgi:hypothetical protein